MRSPLIPLYPDQAPQCGGGITDDLARWARVWRPVDLAQPDHTASPEAALDWTGACVVWLCLRGCRVVALGEVEGMHRPPLLPG
jgi:hypothetical protein